MKRGVLKPKSAYNKFAKTEEHARWAIRRRKRLKLEALQASQDIEPIYPIEPIKPSNEWRKIGTIVKQAQDQFLRSEPGEISPSAKTILAHDYTPEGRAVKKLMEQLDKEAK